MSDTSSDEEALSFTLAILAGREEKIIFMNN